MNILLSSLAFRSARDPSIARLGELGFMGLEGVLTKIAPWRESTKQLVCDYVGWLSESGLCMPSLQAIFHDSGIADFSHESECIEHLEKVVGLASAIGSRVLVLGAPRMRTHGSLRGLSSVAREVDPLLRENGMVLCIEPNCAMYGAGYLRTPSEIVDFILLNELTHVRTMIDTFNLEYEGLECSDEFRKNEPKFAHAHFSGENLKPLLFSDSHRALVQNLTCFYGFLTYELGECEEPLVEAKSFCRFIRSSTG